MITQYNRQQNRIFPLTQKGFNQAKRNNSHQIWSLLDWVEERSFPSDTSKKQHEQTFETTINEPSKNVSMEEKPPELTKKSVSFKVSKNEDIQQSRNNSQNINKEREDSSKKFEISKKTAANQQQTKIQTEYQKLKRKSIQKYIKKQIPYTRTLPNSAFRKFYQRPCPEAYGNKNTHIEGGAFYGNFMKTHNIQPHTLDNKPQNYQTFLSALNFGKRTKLDLDDRWKRIQRQLAKNVDFRQFVQMRATGQIQLDSENKDNVLKENINVYGQEKGKYFTEAVSLTKTSKSLGKMATKATLGTTFNDEVRSNSQEKKRARSSDKPLYFIYKMKQEEDTNGYSCTRYARDRHGITCYVDNCFRENDEAYVNFLKKIKPIYPQKCRPEDVNIDQIRIKNSQKNKNQQLSKHYLIPNVEVPYMPSKYSRKKQQGVAQRSN